MPSILREQMQVPYFDKSHMGYLGDLETHTHLHSHRVAKTLFLIFVLCVVRFIAFDHLTTRYNFASLFSVSCGALCRVTYCLLRRSFVHFHMTPTASSLSHFVVIPTRTHKHSCQTTTHTRARCFLRTFAFAPLPITLADFPEHGSRSTEPTTATFASPHLHSRKNRNPCQRIATPLSTPQPEASHGHPT